MNFKGITILTLILIGFLTPIISQAAIYTDTPPNNYGSTAFRSSQMLDSMLADYYKAQIINHTQDIGNEFIVLSTEQKESEEGMPLDSIYEKRLQMITSVVTLPYNKVVKEQIRRFTANPRSSGIVFGRSMYYFPLIERELAAAGLPIELRMLSVIESALQPTILSHVGAGGLWQFTRSTGKMNGLRINSFIDERFDPIKSTKAACQFLKDLYKIYCDWALVLAAYNCGPGNVNKAIARTPEATTYWDIYFKLPEETRGFVPAFVGATYAYTFHKEHNIEFTTPQHSITVDTVMISGKLLHFKQIASTIDQVSVDMLRQLNPMYRMDIIPAQLEPFALVLPQNVISEFMQREAEIDEKAPIYLSEYLNIANLDMSKQQYFYHTVKQGEVLGLIARKYNVSVSNLMKWNNIKDARKVRYGQKLKIYSY